MMLSTRKSSRPIRVYFNDTAATEISTLSLTTLFRSIPLFAVTWIRGARTQLAIQHASRNLLEVGSENEKRRQMAANESLGVGGADGTRTRDLRRDRPAV